VFIAAKVLMTNRTLTILEPSIQNGVLEYLYGRHSATLVGLTTGIVKDKATAEDIVAEAFIRALGQTVEFANERAAFAWLRQIARRIALDELRHKKVLAVGPIDDSAAPAIASAEPQAFEGLADPEMMAVLAQIPVHYREVLLLTAAGFDAPAIARRLNSTPGAVRVKIHRARKEARMAKVRLSPEVSDANEVDPPYVKGDVVWYLYLDGILRGPYTVLAGPGRAPNPRLCLLAGPDGETVEYDARELWRDVPGLRDLALLEERSWAAMAEWSVIRHAVSPAERFVLAAPEGFHETTMAAHRAVEEMSQRHPYRDGYRRHRLFGPVEE
jgi:RNA polymerase sigma factor (sigma-70 family)